MKRAPGMSPEGLVKAMADAAKGPPEIPAHVKLRKADLPFWDAILKARARDEWVEVDLVMAGQLARCQRDIELASRKRDVTVQEINGRRVVIHKVDVVNKLSAREMALMRTLRMGGRTMGDPQIEAGRRAAQRRAERVRTDLQDEEYIAV